MNCLMKTLFVSAYMMTSAIASSEMTDRTNTTSSNDRHQTTFAPSGASKYLKESHDTVEAKRKAYLDDATRLEKAFINTFSDNWTAYSAGNAYYLAGDRIKASVFYNISERFGVPVGSQKGYYSEYKDMDEYRDFLLSLANRGSVDAILEIHEIPREDAWFQKALENRNPLACFSNAITLRRQSEESDNPSDSEALLQKSIDYLKLAYDGIIKLENSSLLFSRFPVKFFIINDYIRRNDPDGLKQWLSDKASPEDAAYIRSSLTSDPISNSTYRANAEFVNRVLS